MYVLGVVLRDMPSSGFAMCRLSLTPRQMQEALTPGHLKKAKLMFFFTRYPSSTLLKTYFLDVQVKGQQPELGAGWGSRVVWHLACLPGEPWGKGCSCWQEMRDSTNSSKGCPGAGAQGCGRHGLSAVHSVQLRYSD